jgi:hypothetical protein
MDCKIESKNLKEFQNDIAAIKLPPTPAGLLLIVEVILAIVLAKNLLSSYRP